MVTRSLHPLFAGANWTTTLATFVTRGVSKTGANWTAALATIAARFEHLLNGHERDHCLGHYRDSLATTVTRRVYFEERELDHCVDHYRDSLSSLTVSVRKLDH